MNREDRRYKLKNFKQVESKLLDLSSKHKWGEEVDRNQDVKTNAPIQTTGRTVTSFEREKENKNKNNKYTKILE